MSDLQQLKQKLEQISSDAKRTGDNLAGFKSKFSQSVGDVTRTIGGSAQRTDKQIIETLQAAQKQVESATQALHAAAQSATSYAHSL